MANIREYEKVRSLGDVQNLITSVILHQSDPFSARYICDTVERKLLRSDFAKDGQRRSEVDITKMVDETLNIMLFNLCVGYNTEQKEYYLTLSFPAV